MHGIIEGFYGTPWTWEERRAVLATAAAAGMDTWVHAPKDDPLHRERWREPWPEEFLRDLAEVNEDDVVRIGMGISPGLTIDADDHRDRVDLAVKVGQAVDAGVTLVGLLLDDIPPTPGAGAAHGRLTRWLRDELPAEVELFMVPLHYTGTSPAPYLGDLAPYVTADVPIGWTGPLVVNDAITAADAEARADTVGGHRPLLWDNAPCNDVVMGSHLNLGPLRGRDPELPNHLSGYLANPMVQAAASVPALVSAASWWHGDDPALAWRSAIGGAAVLAEACDPRWTTEACDAVLDGDASAVDALDDFLAAAEHCDDGGLGPGVQPWVDQVRAEAPVARLALRVLASTLRPRTGDPGEAGREAARDAAALVLFWPPLRRGRLHVFGGRGGMRPALAQDSRSEWVAHPSCLEPPRSIVDRLVAAAMLSLACDADGTAEDGRG